MKYSEKQQNDAMDQTSAYFDEAVKKGAKVYKTPGDNYVLWLPWRDELHAITDTKTLSHFLVIAKLIPKQFPMRQFILNDFVEVCMSESEDWITAPTAVKKKLGKMFIR